MGTLTTVKLLASLWYNFTYRTLLPGPGYSMQGYEQVRLSPKHSVNTDETGHNKRSGKGGERKGKGEIKERRRGRPPLSTFTALVFLAAAKLSSNLASSPPAASFFKLLANRTRKASPYQG